MWAAIAVLSASRHQAASAGTLPVHAHPTPKDPEAAVSDIHIDFRSKRAPQAYCMPQATAHQRMGSRSG